MRAETCAEESEGGCMNKAEAIKTLQELWRETNDSWYEETYKMAIEALSERTGEWIFEKTDEYKRTYCSVCGGSAPFICVSDDYYGRRLHGETRKTKFCPTCGARMSGEEE